MTMALKFDIRTSVNRALDFVKYGAATMYAVGKGSDVRPEVIKKYNLDRKKINTMPLETAEKLQSYYIGHQAAFRLNIVEIMNDENEAVKKNALGEVANEEMKNESQDLLEDREFDQHNYEFFMGRRQKSAEKELIAYAKEFKIEFDIAGNIVEVEY